MGSPWAPLIAVHAIAATYSLVFGLFQLVRRRKGGPLHRFVGRTWVICMYIVVLTSFGIYTIDGGFTWLHGLSIFTFCTVTIGLRAAVKGKIKAHKSFMTGSYFGIVGAFIGVIVVPERRIPQMAIHNAPSLTLWILVLLASAVFTVFGAFQLTENRKLSNTHS